MTALAGWIDFAGRPQAAARCHAMLAAQALWGQGEPQVRASGGAALGRRLTACLEEDRFDTGPVLGAGGRLTLAADLRLDNRAELIAALGIDLERAAVSSDAMLAMAAFERWGEEAIERFLGDFALALWDAGERRLLLARDHVGHRPLCWHRGSGFVAVASMPAGLHALPEVPRRVDLQAMRRYLAGGRIGSFHEGVEHVTPGTILRLDASGETARRYWHAPAELRGGSLREAQETFRELLDQAVGATLRDTHGRVASHLSGGLDSSAVTATAARAIGGGELTAFTAVPAEALHISPRHFADEGTHAAATAARYANIRHIRVPTPGVSPLELLDRSAMLYQRPLANICNGPWTMAIADAAKADGLHVLLTGQLGNLGFSDAGHLALPELFRRREWRRLIRLVVQLRGQGRGVPGIVRQALGVPWPRRASEPPLLREPLGVGPTSPPTSLAAKLHELARYDPGPINKGMLAGWSLDQRDPTADRRPLDFALSLPVEWFITGGIARGFAREALADRLPAQVLAERRKGVQAADWHRPFTARRDLLEAEVDAIARSPAAAEVIDIQRMQSMVAEMPPTLDDPLPASRYRMRLLPALAAGHFIRTQGG